MLWFCLFVCGCGLALSGIVHSVWMMCTGQPVGLAMLSTPSFWAPVKGLVLVLSGPVLLLAPAFETLSQAHRPTLAMSLAALCGAGLSFIHGIAVLGAIAVV